MTRSTLQEAFFSIAGLTRASILLFLGHCPGYSYACSSLRNEVVTSQSPLLTVLPASTSLIITDIDPVFPSLR